MKKILPLYLFVMSASLQAQTSIGAELQAYPAGVVPGIRFDIETGSYVNLTSRIAYNFTHRRDWGKHDNEEGGGLGLSLGVETNNLLTEDFSVHARTDLWFMEIDWRRDIQLCNNTGCTITSSETGSSNITIFQPTIGIGYRVPFAAHYFIKPTASFGYEINIYTKGEPVGEGPVFLGGFQLGYLF